MKLAEKNLIGTAKAVCDFLKTIVEPTEANSAADLIRYLVSRNKEQLALYDELRQRIAQAECECEA